MQVILLINMMVNDCFIVLVDQSKLIKVDLIAMVAHQIINCILIASCAPLKANKYLIQTLSNKITYQIIRPTINFD